MKIEITNEMIDKLIDTYESNKDALYEADSFIEKNGCLDNGVADIHETFEMGYNNALQYVFSVLGIDDYETRNAGTGQKFAIRIEEIIGKTIIVEAEDLEEAVGKAENACNNNEILIDGIEDFVDRVVRPSDTIKFKNGIVPDGADVSFYEHLR